MTIHRYSTPAPSVISKIRTLMSRSPLPGSKSGNKWPVIEPRTIHLWMSHKPSTRRKHWCEAYWGTNNNVFLCIVAPFKYKSCSPRTSVKNTIEAYLAIPVMCCAHTELSSPLTKCDRSSDNPSLSKQYL